MTKKMSNFNDIVLRIGIFILIPYNVWVTQTLYDHTKQDAVVQERLKGLLGKAELHELFLQFSSEADYINSDQVKLLIYEKEKEKC